MLWSATLMAQKPVSTMVHFPVNGDEIESVASSKLKSAMLSLDLPYRCYLVTISGHTDADGDLAFNAALSQRRAESVLAWLKNEGMTDQSVSIAGEGELRPLASNDSETGKARNRRVELRFTPNPDGCPKPFDFDVSFFEIDLDANQAANFTYKPSGTQVHIPGNSLVDAHGNKVSGKVTFRYREWRNPVEFLVSNITMDYPRRFSGQHFQSGGMFELRAIQDGKELQMAPGRNAQVDFVLTDSSRSYDLYSLDEDRDQWHGPNVNPFASGGPLTDGSGRNGVLPKICEESVVFQRGADTVQNFISLLDTALYYLDQPRADGRIEFTRLPTFERCWSNRDYAGVDFIGDLSPEEKEEYQGITLSANPIRRSRKWQRLRILDKRGMHPELKAIEHVELYISTSSSKKLSGVLAKTYTDFRLLQRGGRSAVLMLKDPSRFHKISVRIRDKRRNRPVKKEKVWDAYQVQLSIRKANYANLRLTNLPNIFWNYSKVIMDQEERCMNKPDWLYFFSKKRKKMKERYARTKEACLNNPELAGQMITSYLDNLKFRLDQGISVAPRPPAVAGYYTDSLLGNFMADLTVSGFGVWNCDQIARLKNPVRLQPVYLDQNGDEIAMSTLSVIDQSINGVLCYNVHYKIPVAFGKNSLAVFVGVAQNGKRYYLGYDEVAKLIPYHGKSVNLKMAEIPDEVDSVDELHDLLGIGSWQTFGMR